MKGSSVFDQTIYHLQSSVRTMHTQLGQKEADLRRLKAARNKLVDDQEELHRNEHIFQKPVLPVNPWRGELARDFQSFRQGELLTSYQVIGKVQLNQVLLRLEGEIMNLEQSIGNIQRQITSTNANITELKERRKEVLRHS